MTDWKIQQSRVYGDGQSYNCTNIATAKTLQNTLNNYEQKIEQLNQLIDIENQLKIITMDLKIIKHDLDTVKNKLEITSTQEKPQE